MYSTFMTDYDSTPKGIREHKDLAMALLAHVHYRLRLERPEERNVDRLLDDAIELLERRGMQEMGVRATRYELQRELAPHVKNILAAFQKVVVADEHDGVVRHELAEEETEDYCDYTHNAQARTIIEEEYHDTLVKSNVDDHHGGESMMGEELFYKRKLGALSTLRSFHKWSNVHPNDTTTTTTTTTTTPCLESSDDFGYISQGVDPEIVKAIRNYQTQNILRSTLIRKELGYSVLALKSTIPNAGRGVFVDGSAMEGSIVAFIPGQVLPREYLTQEAASLDEYLAHDETHLLSLRSDDILIDSRKSPYTVLSNVGSNPWAIGHVMNHPPPGVIPNCRTVLLDFTQSMNLESTGGFMRFVPNSYKRNPMLLGPKLLERDRVIMHGMAIMTRRDVCDEELFYDYKFDNSSQDNPTWYVDATYEDWADERDY